MRICSKCAGGVLLAQPTLQMESGGEIPTSAHQLGIIEINTVAARDLNQIWHSRLPNYKTGFCLNSKVCYGGTFDSQIFAVAIWSNPVSRLLPQKTCLELRRFAICPHAPKNTASRMLSIMKRLIAEKFPEVTRLVSYQDVEAHKGTIYKAAGWQSIATHRGGSWNRPNSTNSSNGKPRTRPDSNNAIGAKVRWETEITRGS
ncbi:MAG: hypothetical protein UY48_C0011G0041 [Candidatus Gottesmanbacteria bacterium GW2011_GWB1_49_7]|uniref:N-acetyltransferase domain-containing protein n=1 Tax=Candidatus Gottesmanbacteria bacterium GW2011_GWB1_49_7 TaxID=1618448 RepID=A0A0G1Z1L2_9BACT|nr:MAG: hypothetical protein UY48_C0011G0041 [Candidatus Gottesmanbacteria bacterium GW2011_GWB1_49_7]